jgi:hypothetical protein
VPDDLIYCPACNHQLRLPADLLGQQVECPQCHAHFTAPAPQEAPPVRPAGAPAAELTSAYADDTEARAYRGRSNLTAPAVCLLIMSILAGIMYGFWFMFGLSIEADPAEFKAQMRAEMDRNPNLTPQQRQMVEEWINDPARTASFVKVYCSVSLACAVLTAFGAIAMLARRMYWLALLGAIAALNPVNCCCLDLNIPFAIWALIVLLSANGRAAFR